MKRIILLILAIVVITYNIKAQDDDSRTSVRVGIKTGVNLSNVYDTEGEEFRADAKFGFAAGVFLAIPIGKFIGVQPEILFSQRGFKGDGSILGNKYELSRTSNFIDIPVLFAIKPVDFLTILVGPQYSFLVSQKNNFSNSIITYEQTQEFENNNVRKNILCFTAGADININHMVFGARAGWDVQKNNGDGSSYVPRYKNVWYQATIGYRF
jgi:hypothetical protein